MATKKRKAMKALSRKIVAKSAKNTKRRIAKRVTLKKKAKAGTKRASSRAPRHRLARIRRSALKESKASKRLPRNKRAKPFELPKDLFVALDGHGLLRAFEVLPQRDRDRFIRSIESAKGIKARIARIEKAVAEVAFGGYHGFMR